MLIRLPSRHRALPMLAVSAAMLAAGPANAAVIPFGTDFAGVAANSDPATTCKDGSWWFVIDGLSINLVGSTQDGSCQFTDGDFSSTASSGLAAPATGTATAARVKVGAITGPMRINVVRSKWEKNEDGDYAWSAPYLQTFGPSFTPAANGVTTVPLSLPLRFQPVTTGKDPAVDWLALELLTNDVPVPLLAMPDVPFYASFPGPTERPAEFVRDAPLPNNGQTGYAVAMNADLTTPPPAGTPTPTPPPASGGATPTPRPTSTPTPAPATGTQTTPAGPSVSLATRTVQQAGGRAPIDLRCDNADCVGQLTLLHRTARGLTAPTESIGKADFSAQAGTTTRVSVALNARGKQLLASKRVVQLRASISLTGAGAPTALGFRLLR